MKTEDILLALQVGRALTQQAADWQAATAAGSITDAQLDAKIVELNLGSRAELAQAIAEARAAEGGEAQNPAG